MTDEVGKTMYQLFVKGIKGENLSILVHKVKSAVYMHRYYNYWGG